LIGLDGIAKLTATNSKWCLARAVVVMIRST
jgi:hypothetical protein